MLASFVDTDETKLGWRKFLFCSCRLLLSAAGEEADESSESEGKRWKTWVAPATTVVHERSTWTGINL